MHKLTHVNMFPMGFPVQEGEKSWICTYDKNQWFNCVYCFISA